MNLNGRSLVVIDPIRYDIKSGGRTATDTLIKLLGCGRKIQIIKFSPRGNNIFFGLKNITGSLFVFLSKRYSAVWLEFGTRLSLSLVITSLLCLIKNPGAVLVLNHHSVFYLARIFWWVEVVFVWHDVPSYKRDEAKDMKSSIRACLLLERFFSNRKCFHITFSTSDRRWLRLVHGYVAKLCPAVLLTPKTEPAILTKKLLLVANWYRQENCDGAIEFFSELAAQSKNLYDIDEPDFHLAGFGAGDFSLELYKRGVAPKNLQVTNSFDSLSSFSQLALLVPLIRGGGIKLKTLEAWAANIAVIGTRQAFTGLPKKIVSLGGLVFPDIRSLASYCLNVNSISFDIKSLYPVASYQKYIEVTAFNNPEDKKSVKS